MSDLATVDQVVEAFVPVDAHGRAQDGSALAGHEYDPLAGTGPDTACGIFLQSLKISLGKPSIRPKEAHLVSFNLLRLSKMQGIREMTTSFGSHRRYIDSVTGKPGVVYVLVNRNLRPGVVKIGASTRSGHHRADDLNRDARTGMPASYQCVFEYSSIDCGAAEKMVHTALHSRREGKWGQEFFEVDVESAKTEIEKACDFVNAPSNQRRVPHLPPYRIAAEAVRDSPARPATGFNITDSSTPVVQLHEAAPGQAVGYDVLKYGCVAVVVYAILAMLFAERWVVANYLSRHSHWVLAFALLTLVAYGMLWRAYRRRQAESLPRPWSGPDAIVRNSIRLAPETHETHETFE